MLHDIETYGRIEIGFNTIIDFNKKRGRTEKKFFDVCEKEGDTKCIMYSVALFGTAACHAKAEAEHIVTTFESAQVHRHWFLHCTKTLLLGSAILQQFDTTLL